MSAGAHGPVLSDSWGGHFRDHPRTGGALHVEPGTLEHVEILERARVVVASAFRPSTRGSPSTRGGAL